MPFSEHKFSFFMDKFLGVGLVSCMLSLCLTFLKTDMLLSKVAVLFYIPTRNVIKVLVSPHSHQHLLFIFWIIALLMNM